MTNKDIFWDNCKVLHERMHNLQHIMRNTNQLALNEAMNIITSMRLNLTLMEDVVNSLKQWTEKE